MAKDTSKGAGKTSGAFGTSGGKAKANVRPPRQGAPGKNTPAPKSDTMYGKQPGGTRGSGKGSR